MELRRYIEVLDRRKWVILVTVLATLLVVGLGSMSRPPVYASSAVVRVAELDADGRVTYNEWNYSERLINTYIHLLTTRPFLEQIISRLGLNIQPWELTDRISAEQVAKTELIRITAEDSDPEEASRIANALSTQLVEQESRGGRVLSIIESAVTHGEPEGFGLPVFLFIGFIVGLVGGTALAFIQENLDPAIHSAEELQAAVPVPILGRIPRSQALAKPRAAVDSQGGLKESRAGEAFRLLGTSTLAVASKPAPWGPQERKLILVTGVEPRTGNSTVVANLAVAIARSGRRVIAVDANFRDPCLHEFFGLPNKRGLAEALLEPSRPDLGLQLTRALGLRVLSSGMLAQGSSDLLSSGNMHQLLQRLARDADVVLLDSPSALASADAVVLAPIVDGVVVVVSRDETKVEQVEQMLQQLERVGGYPLGIVFNRAREESSSRRYIPTSENDGNGSRTDAAATPPLKKIV